MHTTDCFSAMHKQNGSLVKRLRRRPLTAETGVRFPYELLTIILKHLILLVFWDFVFLGFFAT